MQMVNKAGGLGADYVEDGKAVFKIPKKYGSNTLAIELGTSGYVRVGIVDGKCDNFRIGSLMQLYKPELQWVTMVFKKLMADKRVKLKV